MATNLQTPIQRITSSEEALKVAFHSIPTNMKFYEIIDSYFQNKCAPKEEIDSAEYEIIKKYIKDLWARARKTTDFLDFTSNFEPLLKDLGLRDHFKHSLNVYLLGYYIINQLNREKENFRYLQSTPEMSNIVWLLAATFHDTAYAVEKTDDWLNDFFSKFLGVNPQFALKISEVLTPAYTDIMRMLSMYHRKTRTTEFNFSFDDMEWFYYNELSRELSRKNHGVLSALMLCHRMAIKEGFLCRPPKNNLPLDNRNPIEERSQWDFLYHLAASHAISLHSMANIPVKFNQHPFAFVLILCDEIQDWGRGNHRSGNNDEIVPKDFVALEWVEVKVSDMPEIYFKISCNEERKKDLIDTLQKRLVRADESGLRLFINDESIL
jgi:hypothetical protein